MNLEQAFATYDEIFKINLSDDDFIFRPLTRKEFRLLLQSTADGFDFEDAVCTVCTLFPENCNFDMAKAGVPAMLCLLILSVSGFCDGKESQNLLEQSRAIVNSDIETQMDVVILTAFPQYKLEDIQNLTRKSFFDLYAKAEWSLQLRGLQLQMQSDGVTQAQPPPQGRPMPRTRAR